jgi:hypothetical protein
MLAVLLVLEFLWHKFSCMVFCNILFPFLYVYFWGFVFPFFYSCTYSEQIYFKKRKKAIVCCLCAIMYVYILYFFAWFSWCSWHQVKAWMLNLIWIFLYFSCNKFCTASEQLREREKINCEEWEKVMWFVKLKK